MSYAERLHDLLLKQQHLCVGFDPSRAMLASWQLNDDIDGLDYFSMQLADACLEQQVAMVKPQSAFYERHGFAGLKILDKLTVRLREAGVISIFDGKRGDIGSTAAAYADAYLDHDDPHKHDAMTVNPYLGLESLRPFVQKTHEEDVGIFIIVRSSNPQAEQLQLANTHEQHSVAACLAKYIHQQNQSITTTGIGPIGAVIGSTIDGLDDLLAQMPNALFLCPGIGAQGVSVAQALQRFGRYRQQCIFPVSRGISLQASKRQDLIDNIKQLQEQFIS